MSKRVTHSDIQAATANCLIELLCALEQFKMLFILAKCAIEITNSAF
jgi:hypothetical protein